jgi:hypothetical protein
MYTAWDRLVGLYLAACWKTGRPTDYERDIQAKLPQARGVKANSRLKIVATRSARDAESFQAQLEGASAKPPR